MTAKRYLSQVHRLRRQIRALEDQIEFLTNKAQGVKAIEYKADKVDTSPADTFTEVMVELAETTNRFTEKVLEYSKTVERITDQIGEMENDLHVELLTLRYLQTDKRGKRFTLFQIARKMHMSEDRVKHLHIEALAAFAKKYLDREG